MHRRHFLGGILALTVSPALAKVGGVLPVIYSDGVNDDWAGLQAMFDGLPFRVQGENVVAQDGVVSGGNFVLSRCLNLSGRNIALRNSTFTGRNWSGDKFWMKWSEGTSGTMSNCHFDFSEIKSVSDCWVGVTDDDLKADGITPHRFSSIRLISRQPESCGL